ncbi:MAG: PDZ domain-containing protein [Dethiobacter sp.]|nr:PDZ domain-containing protein [Dethiobacter sp.]MBS3899700.1 PDZ domain-containing protein [Dethiobacter sp.]
MESMEMVRLFLGAFARFLLNPLFWLVVLLMASQYSRVARNEMQLFGRAKYSVARQTCYFALLGLAGGFMASLLLVFFGISLLDIGIIYVWPLAVLLLLVHPRYICFAYAGGLVGAFSALLQLLEQIWPSITAGILSGLAGVHIPGLLALIGILHLTESFLIAVSGHLFPSPLYLKTDKGVVGGYSLQKFWPLPLVGLMALLVPQATAEALSGVRMPDWWPLLASPALPGAGETLLYLLTPIVAGLGYGDLAISTLPQQKSRRSALNLGGYSLALIAAAFLAFHYPLFTIPAALLSPLGHELLILLGNKQEFSRAPLFAALENGVKILDIFPRSPAAAAGLISGQVILSVNGLPVNDSLTMQNIMGLAGSKANLEIQGKKSSVELKFSDYRSTGIILAPDQFATVYLEVKQPRFLAALAKKRKLRS